MAQTIKVNTSRLNSDSSQVSECIRAMKSEMGKMKASVSQLDSMWDGESSEAFKSAFWGDMEAMSQIISALEKFQQDEMNAKRKYDDCENEVGSLISGIRV